MNVLGKNFTMVELQIATGTTGTYTFKDQSYLRNNYINSIETFSSTDVPVYLSGLPVASIAQIQGTFLNLWMNDIDSHSNPPSVGQYLRQFPLVCLHRIENAAVEPYVRDPFLLSGQVVSWDKCELSFAPGTVFTTPTSILLKVGFSFNQNNNQN